MSMLNIGKSGLLASMAALNATSNNVANAMVDGYSRQQVMLSSVGGGAYGGGAGVFVDGVRRISDQYEVAQLWQTTSAVGFSKVQSSYLRQAEQVFGAEGNNVSQGLDQLFAALNSSMEQPNLIAYRQGVLNEAKALTQRVNAINDNIDSQRSQINGQLGASAKEVTSQLAIIANFNRDIQAASVTGTIPPALQDGRDAAIDALAAIVDIRVVEDSQGMVNISLARGEPLLTGNTAAKLTSAPDPTNPKNNLVSITFGQSQFNVDMAAGGSLGALLNYRDTQLEGSQAYIDELAVMLATEFNTILAAGTDLNGAAPTQDLFTFDANNPGGSLSITAGFTPDKLAFGKDGSQGDNTNLKDLVQLASKELNFTSLGSNTSFSESFSSKVGQLGSASRQAISFAKTSIDLQNDAQSQWASTSGVSPDEEGINLIIYQQSYMANAKVISTADQLFQVMLSSF
ncbi:flagellar hook-associated protein FlgK [Shewanella morhuae]|uniref:Flagellar hook-associated protein 1 n=1 Tax=Shewanella morhuae TaxID=365591 RepID=A0ABX5HZ71_9GAMM|nr:flagellar hook-associated protein FlgK [Shewanella morhuae]PTA51599.1 flagellar hook-associated protein FlgK [Shewanella morhuae]SIQ96848.1 flagellar hook-associated protein 1 FlgK [Shewanella morhuae]